MIDIEVEKLANHFIRKYSFPLEVNNPYKLNLTLHSTAILDFILDFNFFPARKENLENELLEASSYVALTLHRLFFLTDPHIKVDLTLSELPQKEVKITIRNLPSDIKEASIIKLTSLLREIYITKKIKIESFRGEVLNPSLTSRPIYWLLLGIAMGNSSYFEGPLKTVNESELVVHFNSIFNLLSEELENSIKSSSPILNDIDLSSLINPALIGPPFGYKEKHLGERSFTTLIDRLINSSLTDENKEQFYRALLRMPDLQCSSLGFIFTASGSKPLKSIRELGEFAMTYPIITCAMRGAYQYLRKDRGKEGWETYLSTGDFENAWIELDIEVGCGLLPFLYAYNINEILNLKHFIFYDLLAYGRIDDALKIAKELMKNDPSATFLINYAVHLILSSRLNDSSEIIETLKKHIKDEAIYLEIKNCLEYLSDSISNNLSKIETHQFKPISIPTLWNLNFLYFKVFIENRSRESIDYNQFPTIEEDGLSCLSEFYSYVSVNQITRKEKLKFSANPYNYWLEISKDIQSTT